MGSEPSHQSKEFEVLEKGGRQVEVYPRLSNSQEDFKHTLLALQERKRNYLAAPNVVRLVGHSSETKFGACDYYVSSNIVLQRVSQRLFDKSFREDEALFVLHEVLKGYREIGQVEGYQFQPSLKMMGITPNNEIRVWHHQRFDELKPQTMSRGNAEGATAEQTLVAKITGLIEKLVPGSKFSTDFAQHHGMPKRQHGFDSAIQSIRRYAKLRKQREVEQEVEQVDEVKQDKQDKQDRQDKQEKQYKNKQERVVLQGRQDLKQDFKPERREEDGKSAMSCSEASQAYFDNNKFRLRGRL